MSNSFQECASLFAAFGARLDRRLFPPPAPDAPVLTVVMAPWYGSAVSFFSAVLGLVARHRGDHQVQFLFNDCLFPWPDERRLQEAMTLLQALDVLSDLQPILRLSQCAAVDRMDAAHDLVVASMINDRKHRQGCWNMDLPADEYRRLTRPVLDRMAGHFQGYLDQARPDVVLVPGGVANGMTLLSGLARRSGARVPTYDAGVSVFVGTDGPAPQFHDGPPAVAALRARGGVELARAEEEAHALLREALTGRHPLFDLPFSGAGPDSPFDIVLPVSTEYDSTNLAHPNLFDSQADWVVETVREMHRRLPDIRIALRMHPRERGRTFLYSENVLRSVAEIADQAPGLTIFPADDDTNTYGLIRDCKVLASSGSSVAIDAALMGVPVVSVMDSYATHPLSQVAVFPYNRSAYYDLLQSYVEQPRPLRAVPPAAAATYYLRMRTMSLQPPVTPQTDSFITFLKGGGGFDAIARDPDIAVMMRAILDGENPLLLVHDRRVAAASEPA